MVSNTIEKQNINLSNENITENKTTKSMQKITNEMTDSIWNTFRNEIQHGNCFWKKQGMLIKELSANENSSTGIAEFASGIDQLIKELKRK